MRRALDASRDVHALFVHRHGHDAGAGGFERRARGEVAGRFESQTVSPSSTSMRVTRWIACCEPLTIMIWSALQRAPRAAPRCAAIASRSEQVSLRIVVAEHAHGGTAEPPVHEPPPDVHGEVVERGQAGGGNVFAVGMTGRSTSFVRATRAPRCESARGVPDAARGSIAWIRAPRRRGSSTPRTCRGRRGSGCSPRRGAARRRSAPCCARRG